MLHMLLDLLIIIEDITNVFRSSSKNKDLSDTSKTDKHPKRISEANSASFADEVDIFNEGIDSSSFRDILFNCFENVEAMIMKIYEQRNKNKNTYIKI